MTNQQIVRIEEIATDVQSGFASGERTDDGVVQLRMNNVTTDGSLNWSSYIRVPTSQKQIEKYQLRPGDILFNNTNSPELVGKTAVFKDFGEPVVFSNHFVRLRVDEERVHPQYLAAWFIKQWQNRVFESLCTQWVNQAAVRKEDLLELKLPLPPLTEQKWIASLLARADRLRQLRRTAHDLSDALLQSVFLEMFGDPETNPKKWKVSHIRDLCEKILDCPHETPIHSETETEYASIRSSDIQNGHLDFSTTKCVSYEVYKRRIERGTPMPGDVVYCREGARFGNAARIPKNLNKKICLGQRMMSFRVNPQKATSEFLWAILESPSIYKQAVNMVGGSAAPHVNVQDIKKFNVIIPPLSLQEEFAGVVARVDSLRGRMRESERQVAGLFESLLSESFA
jgi:type I restriction enzyme, S subunit